ncbi:hypothetical protein BDN67DRAFT_472050 [Paxillus ammoniavirescens]|nr:hypothetical protein BDN67DRAFT_472050 [Paxillus ammoniavirescens]
MRTTLKNKQLGFVYLSLQSSECNSHGSLTTVLQRHHPRILVKPATLNTGLWPKFAYILRRSSQTVRCATSTGSRTSTRQQVSSDHTRRLIIFSPSLLGLEPPPDH